MNVAIYGARKRWAMTERGRRSTSISDDEFVIGPSHVRWEDGGLTFSFDEVTVPLPSRVSGRVRVTTPHWLSKPYALDAAGRHRWTPLAPCARVDVELRQPKLSWSGQGYCDSNTGDEPLETAFSRWQWSRTADAAGTSILYEAERRDAQTTLLALQCSPDGAVKPFEAPAEAALRRSRWGVHRSTRADAGTRARIVETLEDAPFYARSIIENQVSGRAGTGVHESLSLDRFASPIVQMMLPFRMPRRA